MFNLGAIDGKHMLISRPENTVSSFYNYKGTYSIVLMPIVDANYRALYADFGARGHNNDAGIWASSGKYYFLLKIYFINFLV